MKKVNTDWSSDLAYAIGIITSDGNLSPDGRHLNITSKDRDIVELMKRLLCLNNKIGVKARGGSREKKYFVLQFGDINFYDFLLSIGLLPAKSKTLHKLDIPDQFFADFLRGCIDGDGSYGYFIHPESKKLQWRIRLCSASDNFLKWILPVIRKLAKVVGGSIYKQKNKSISILTFGAEDTRKIIKFMYHKEQVPALARKRKQARECLTGQVVK